MRDLVVLAAAISMAAATSVYAQTRYGLYQEVYYSDASWTEEVGFRPGSCGGTEVVLGSLVGTETAFSGREYIGYCIGWTPYYY